MVNQLTKQQVIDKVNKIFSQYQDTSVFLYPDGLGAADIICDLGVDSLDIVEFIIVFEKEFGIKVSEDEAQLCAKVKDVYKTVCEKLNIDYKEEPVAELKREDFLNTKWDTRDRTKGMKRQWQEKMFELGFKRPYGGQEVQFTDRNHFYLGDNDYLSFANGHDRFSNHKNAELKYAAAFPERSPEKSYKKPLFSGVEAEAGSVNDTRRTVESDRYGLERLVELCKEENLYISVDPNGGVIVTEGSTDTEYKVSSEDELEKLLSALEVLNSYAK